MFLNIEKAFLKDGFGEILSQIRPWYRLDDGNKFYPEFVENVDNKFIFKNEASLLELIFDTNGDNASISVNFELFDVYNFTALFNSNFLNSRSAVGIDILPKDNEFDFLASRCGHFWTMPEKPEAISGISDHIQAIFFKKSNEYFYLSSIATDEYKSDIYGGNIDNYNCLPNKDKHEGFSVHLFSLMSCGVKLSAPLLVVSKGENPYALPEQATKYGFKLMGRPFISKKERQFPDVFNYLGWCSWDAFHLHVNRDGLLQKAEEFKREDIPVKWLLLDDMWAEVKNNTHPAKRDCYLYSFEADKERFPNGLSETISAIKDKYDLKIGMWYPSSGYWGGIDPNGDITREIPDALVTTFDNKVVPDYRTENGAKFFEKFNTFLKKSGADFIKVDFQSSVNYFYRQIMPIGKAARCMHEALEKSTFKHFDGAIINCMGMASENYWNRPQTAVLRCSDDFRPEDRAWFKKHLLQCSTNSLTQGSLYVPDWDMWWTDDSQSLKNSVLRAMSGGPVYISDQLDRSRREIVLPIVLSNGYILRTDTPAVPCRDSLFFNTESDSIYKVFAQKGDVGIVAAFNLSADETPTKAAISELDVEICGDKVVFDYFGKKAFVLNSGEKVEFTLNGYDDFKFLSLYPKRKITPIGLMDKYISSATFEELDDGRFLLKEGGNFAFYTETAPKSVIVDGDEVDFVSADRFYYVNCGKSGSECIVEVRL